MCAIWLVWSGTILCLLVSKVILTLLIILGATSGVWFTGLKWLGLVANLILMSGLWLCRLKKRGNVSRQLTTLTRMMKSGFLGELSDKKTTLRTPLIITE